MSHIFLPNRGAKLSSLRFPRQIHGRWMRRINNIETHTLLISADTHIQKKKSTLQSLPSGKHTKSYWKWPFIVSFPIKNCHVPYSYVSLTEGICMYLLALSFTFYPSTSVGHRDLNCNLPSISHPSTDLPKTSQCQASLVLPAVPWGLDAVSAARSSPGHRSSWPWRGAR